MPLYDFTCSACGAAFEAFAPPGEVVPCEKCGSSEVKRVWQAPAVGGGPWLRGAAAKRSDEKRSIREEKRQERRGS